MAADLLRGLSGRGRCTWSGEVFEEWRRQEVFEEPIEATFAKVFLAVRRVRRAASLLRGAQGCDDDADLHACHAEAGLGRAESAGLLAEGQS